MASKHPTEEPKLAFSVRDVDARKSLLISCSAFSDFFSFIEHSQPHVIVDFFRDVFSELENKHRLLDFHLKLRGTSGLGFEFDVFYGDSEKSGPVTVVPRECISCFADVALLPGEEPEVTSGDCILDEIDGDGLVQCSIDAKGRSGFIVTPIRHVERMTDLKNDEVFSLWGTSIKALRSHGLSSFRCMILNHGTYRNLPHLHLKIWVDRASYHHACLSWPSTRKDLWKRLEAFGGCGRGRGHGRGRGRGRVLDEHHSSRCRFYQTKQGCRHGSKCKFLHE